MTVRERHLARPPNPRRRHVVSIRLADDELDDLNRYIKRTGREASDIMREAIFDYVRERLEGWR